MRVWEPESGLAIAVGDRFLSLRLRHLEEFLAD
jgi:hypothetical protein